MKKKQRDHNFDFKTLGQEELDYHFINLLKDTDLNLRHIVYELYHFRLSLVAINKIMEACLENGETDLAKKVAEFRTNEKGLKTEEIKKLIQVNIKKNDLLGPEELVNMSIKEQFSLDKLVDIIESEKVLYKKEDKKKIEHEYKLCLMFFWY